MDELFGPYRLVDRLGQGGMGEVWRAVDTRKDREVAVKVLGAWLGGDPDFARRFRREAALAARLSGPHIVPIHDYGEIDGRMFIDMALVPGSSLADLVTQDGPLPAARAVEVVEQLAVALDTAHDAGMLHRDVKPSNVVVSHRYGRDYAYLIDFGIARPVDGTRISLSGAVVGTPAYMAPEQFDGEGDHRSDVYSLTCVLVHALTGLPPYPATGFWALLRAHHDHSPPRVTDGRPDLLPGLDDVVARGLAKDPGSRFPTAGALAAAARATLTGPTPDAPVPVVEDVRAQRAGATTGSATMVRSAGPTAVPDTGPRVPAADPGPPTAPATPAPRSGRRWWWLAGGLAVALVVLAAALAQGRGVPTPGPTPDEPAVDSATGATPDPVFTTTAGIAVGRSPGEVAITPDGASVLVVNSFSYTVSRIDTATATAVAEIRVGNQPTDIALTSDGRTAYVANYESASLSVLDVASDEVSATIPVGGIPFNVALAPDGSRAYVTDLLSETVAVVDTGSGVIVATVALDGPPTDVAIAPDGLLAYVSSVSDGKVWVVDTAAAAVVAAVDTTAPQTMTVSPDGRELYAVVPDGGVVTVVDTASREPVAEIEVGAAPYDVAFSPDGRTAYVPNLGSDTVSVIDTATRAVIADVPVEGGPSRAVVAPAGTPVYVSSDAAQTVVAIDRS